MKDHIEKRIYHIEVLPPKQETEKLDEDLAAFATKFNRVMESGYCACLTDNAMGNLAFQGTEMIEELGLEAKPDSVMIHLNTFHTKEDLDRILESCKKLGIRQLLVVTGDGSDRLPKLHPADIGAEGVEAVSSVELLRYISRRWPNDFELGVAFNPYEPEEHEFAKFERKLGAGATFVITQPVIDRHPLVDKLHAKYPGVPMIVEAWMSKKLDLLSDAVGYDIPQGTPYDPIENLKALHRNYPDCGAYLSIVGFKTQYDQLKSTWGSGRSNLRIVVCIKQVPGTNDAKIDPETKRIVREGIKAVMNPFDTYALEEAVRIRDKVGGEVIALSMGPPRADITLREALSVGADRAVLLSDRAFGGSDTWATSYALSKAVGKIGGVDLVICGKQAIDGDTAQVGPGIAAHLGWLQATYVMAVSDIADGKLTAKRMHEDGWDQCVLTLPAVLTVVKDINQPRIPTLKGRLAAQKLEIPVWTAEDIGAEPGTIGLDGSPTRVVKTNPPAGRSKETLRIEGSPAECARALVHELRLKSLV
jgi:electron transfer flavoprotein alpha/beta subunit